LLVREEVLLANLCEKEILFRLKIYDRLRQATAKRTILTSSLFIRANINDPSIPSLSAFTLGFDAPTKPARGNGQAGHGQPSTARKPGVRCLLPPSAAQALEASHRVLRAQARPDETQQNSRGDAVPWPAPPTR